MQIFAFTSYVWRTAFAFVLIKCSSRLRIYVKNDPHISNR